jgi:hypothetical protein
MINHMGKPALLRTRFGVFFATEDGDVRFKTRIRIEGDVDEDDFEAEPVEHQIAVTLTETEVHELFRGVAMLMSASTSRARVLRGDDKWFPMRTSDGRFSVTHDGRTRLLRLLRTKPTRRHEPRCSSCRRAIPRGLCCYVDAGDEPRHESFSGHMLCVHCVVGDTTVDGLTIKLRALGAKETR